MPGLNNEEYQVVIGNDTTHYIIDDLEPASNYTFYIVAYMPLGASQMSDHVTQHTLEDGKKLFWWTFFSALSWTLQSSGNSSWGSWVSADTSETSGYHSTRLELIKGMRIK